jgi:ABC-type uncharacterized transport system ATPase component
MTIEENLSLAVLRGRTRGLRIATNKRRWEFFCSALAHLGLGLEAAGEDDSYDGHPQYGDCSALW